MGKKSKKKDKAERNSAKKAAGQNKISNDSYYSNFNYLNDITFTSTPFEDAQISLLEGNKPLRNLTHKETNDLMNRFLLDAKKLSEEEVINKIETDTCFKNMWSIAQEADQNLPDKSELPEQSFVDKYVNPNSSIGRKYD